MSAGGDEAAGDRAEHAGGGGLGAFVSSRAGLGCCSPADWWGTVKREAERVTGTKTGGEGDGGWETDSGGSKSTLLNLVTASGVWEDVQAGEHPETACRLEITEGLLNGATQTSQ